MKTKDVRYEKDECPAAFLKTKGYNNGFPAKEYYSEA